MSYDNLGDCKVALFVAKVTCHRTAHRIVHVLRGSNVRIWQFASLLWLTSSLPCASWVCFPGYASSIAIRPRNWSHLSWLWLIPTPVSCCIKALVLHQIISSITWYLNHWPLSNNLVWEPFENLCWRHLSCIHLQVTADQSIYHRLSIQSLLSHLNSYCHFC